MSKLYYIPMALVVEALDVDKAAGLAELSAFRATTMLRQLNSWVVDETTSLVTRGTPMECTSVPLKIYDKEVLVKAFGEEKAIDFLNSYTGR